MKTLNDVSQEKREKIVEEFVQQILRGAGWATDDYVLNYAPPTFTKKDKHYAMWMLAEADALYTEDFSDEAMDKAFNGEEPSDDRAISLSDLKKRFIYSD